VTACEDAVQCLIVAHNLVDRCLRTWGVCVIRWFLLPSSGSCPLQRDIPIGAKPEVMTTSISIAMDSERKNAFRCVDGRSRFYQKAIGTIIITRMWTHTGQYTHD
jgi:hypothetical protein